MTPETKITYIDAYNLLRKIPRYVKLLRSNSDAARRSLVEFLRTHPRVRGRVIVVFDGFGEPINAGKSLEVVFAQTRTADSYIRMKLETEKQVRQVAVVSSDHEVQNHATALGAQIINSEVFLNLREETPHARTEDEKFSDAELSRKEVEQWLKEFEKKDSGKE